MKAKMMKAGFAQMLLPMICLVPVALGQGQVLIDWRGPTLISYPQIVSQRINTVVVVDHVNDLLYQYVIALTATPRNGDDASGLFAAVTGAQNQNSGIALVQNSCTSAVSALNDSVASIGQAVTEIFDSTRKNANGNYRTLDELIIEWNTRVKANTKDLAAKAATVAAVCQGDDLNISNPALSRARVLQLDIDARQRRIDGPHQIQQAVTLNPDTDYKVDVTEVLPDGTATGRKFSGTFSPTSYLLTLSLGTLLSEVQQRSYSAAKDPANTQQNLVSVNGAGRFSPLGVALLNYEIPKASGQVIGLTLSSGLVLRFGASDVGASSLGWFGGAGFHLYHRFFIALGAHVGQFSDFPFGLQRGSVVPANYGDLTGQNHTTTRFAFAVTYQTKKFSTGSTTPKTQTSLNSQSPPSPPAAKLPK